MVTSQILMTLSFFDALNYFLWREIFHLNILKLK